MNMTDQPGRVESDEVSQKVYPLPPGRTNLDTYTLPLTFRQPYRYTLRERCVRPSKLSLPSTFGGPPQFE